MFKKIPDNFIFMKIGNHAGESFEEILTRKNKEYKDTGMIFWGYGGVACHPIYQVQPFARLSLEKHGSIYLIMNSVKSNADQDKIRATEYSEDGVHWIPVPDDINVLGSRYALVLDEIKPAELQVDLDAFSVGVGPSRGKVASKYLTGRTDKACLTRVDSSDSEEMGHVKKIDYIAKLQEPYAVLLR